MYGPQGLVYGPPRQVRPACVKKVRDVFAPSRWERSDVWTDARTSAWGDYEITTRSRRDYEEITKILQRDGNVYRCARAWCRNRTSRLVGWTLTSRVEGLRRRER